jgi:NADH-quinone oxidoreductase subunit E
MIKITENHKSAQFELSPEGLARVKKELGRYEDKMSAIIPSLYIAQEENRGYISEPVIRHLSEIMDIPESRINEVFKFYTMFNQKPVGRYHVQVCGTLSCHINGAQELIDHLCSSLKVKKDQITEDGKYTVSRVECLGSCGTAPMMQVNEVYYENLTKESAMNILRGLK